MISDFDKYYLIYYYKSRIVKYIESWFHELRVLVFQCQDIKKKHIKQKKNI